MKKILMIVGVLAVILVVAVGIFLATFDLNRYRPLILKQIQTATGKEARIGRVGLAWDGGVAARVQGLALFDRGDAEPDASVDEVVARLEWAPLLRKEVRVSSVSIEGLRVVAERSAQGVLSVAGIRPPASSTASSSGVSAASSAGSMVFSVGQVRIANAAIRWVDHSPASPMDVTISDLDAEFKNLSPGKPVTFAARAAVFSVKQSIALGGRLTPPLGGEPARLDGFTLKADLGSVDLARLFEAVPSLRASGLQAPLEGILEARIDRMDLDPQALAAASARISLRDGQAALASVPLPLQNIGLEATLQNGTAEIENLSARFAEGELRIQGTVKNLTGRPQAAFRMEVKEVAVGKLAQIASSRAPRLEGSLSLDFEGRGEGLDAASLTQTLTGQGRLALKNGVIVNANLLRTIVDKISKIPGVGEAAISRIPPQYLAKINEPSTILKPFEAPFAVQQGRVFFDRLSVPTELFLLDSSGSIGFDRSLALRSAIVLDGGLSKALGVVAPPVQYLFNPAGQIQVQAEIQGVPPAVQVTANLDAALQRFAVDKGQQLVTDLLQKKDKKEILQNLLGGPGGAQEAAPAQAPTGAPAQSGGIPVEGAEAPAGASQGSSEEDALVGLLSKALSKKSE